MQIPKNSLIFLTEHPSKKISVLTYAFDQDCNISMEEDSKASELFVQSILSSLEEMLLCFLASNLAVASSDVSFWHPKSHAFFVHSLVPLGKTSFYG